MMFAIFFILWYNVVYQFQFHLNLHFYLNLHFLLGVHRQKSNTFLTKFVEVSCSYVKRKLWEYQTIQHKEPQYASLFSEVP